jgi:predicted nuclease of restriction endonuclease-like (RecB) superfamily
MNQAFDFAALVELCRQTHEEMQGRVGRTISTSHAARNWLFGWYIVEYEQNGADRAAYGEATLQRLSAALKENIGRGFSVDSLEQMRRFYLEYRRLLTAEDKSETAYRISLPEISETASRIFEIRPTVSDESRPAVARRREAVAGLSEYLVERFRLGWSQYVALLTIDDPDERRFYEIEAAQNQWSVRELERQIASSLYERLALSRDKDEIRRLACEGQVVEKAADLIKNPLVLEFLDLEEKPAYTEDELESAIIDRLETFLLELGKGFLFEARQKRFTFDGEHFHVDLVFYNRLLRCYVLIDLKRDKLTHQDLGQMQMYVNYFDRYVKTGDELPTVGIVLCHRKNDALVELTLPQDANIFASKYQLYLPSKEELKRQLERVQAELGGAREWQEETRT